MRIVSDVVGFTKRKFSTNHDHTRGVSCKVVLYVERECWVGLRNKMIDLLVVLDLDLVYSTSMGKFDQINGNNGFNVLFMILFL